MKGYLSKNSRYTEAVALTITLSIVILCYGWFLKEVVRYLIKNSKEKLCLLSLVREIDHYGHDINDMTNLEVQDGKGGAS